MTKEGLSYNELQDVKAMLLEEFSIPHEAVDRMVNVARLATVEMQRYQQEAALARQHKELLEKERLVDDNLRLEGKLLSADDIQQLFGTKVAEVKKRIREDGVAPLIAMASTREQYKAMSFVDKFLSGWEQLCLEFGQPADETPFMNLTERKQLARTEVEWQYKGGDGYLNWSAGAKETAHMLAAHHDNAAVVALTWTQAIARALRVERITADLITASKGFSPDGAGFLRDASRLCRPHWHAASIENVVPGGAFFAKIAKRFRTEYDTHLVIFGEGLYNFTKIVVQCRREVYERMQLDVEVSDLSSWNKYRQNFGIVATAPRQLLRRQLLRREK